MTAATVMPATSAEDVDAVRTLCWAYREFLLATSERDRRITEAFYPVEKYTALMADLPQIHKPPKGIMLLARNAAGQPVGCGMTHPLDEETSEIKRVFVTDAARGNGVARTICKALIKHAKQIGFNRIVLDTSASLSAAQALYTRLGFAACGPYQPIPQEVLPDLVFYELAL